MLPLRHSSSVERRLNRHATTVLVGGLFLTLCGVLFLALCSSPCADNDNNNNADRSQGLRGEGGVQTRLVVVVMSAVQNSHQRLTLRHTWLADAPPTHLVVVRFVLGMGNVTREVEAAVQREQVVHQDLLLLPSLQESYSRLTTKLLLALHWAHTSLHFAFLLKVDDDSYVRLGLLLQELHHLPAQRLYWGFFNGRARVKTSGKWAEKDWFLCDRYLPYAVGGGYVLSHDLVTYLAASSPLLQQYRSEDVSLGAWLAPLHIHRLHDQRFDTEFVSRGCQDDYLITHKQTAAAMQQLHSNLKTLGRLCQRPLVRRQSYNYNWTVLPSHCCQRDDRILLH